MKRLVFLLFAFVTCPLIAEQSENTTASIIRERDDAINVKFLDSIIEKHIATEPIDNLGGSQSATDKGMLSYAFGNVLISILRVATPMQGAEFEKAIALNPKWSDSPDPLKKQHAYIVITVVSTKISKSENLFILSQVTGAVLRSCTALGVYWSSSQMLLTPQRFNQLTDGMMRFKPPVALWVNLCKTTSADGKIQVHTIGLGHFAIPEFEVIDLQATDWSSVSSFLLSVAQRCLRQPSRLPREGEKVSVGEQQYRIEYRKSELGNAEKVMRIFM